MIGGSVAPAAGEGLRYIDIAPTLKSKADAMLPFFGEECTVRVFHRRWQLREEGVKTFIEKLPTVFQHGQEENLIVLVNSAVLSTLVETFKDKVQHMLSYDASEAYIEQLMLYPAVTARSD